MAEGAARELSAAKRRAAADGRGGGEGGALSSSTTDARTPTPPADIRSLSAEEQAKLLLAALSPKQQAELLADHLEDMRQAELLAMLKPPADGEAGGGTDGAAAERAQWASERTALREEVAQLRSRLEVGGGGTRSV